MDDEDDRANSDVRQLHPNVANLTALQRRVCLGVLVAQVAAQKAREEVEKERIVRQIGPDLCERVLGLGRSHYG